MLPGDYTIMIEKPEYETYEGEHTINGDEITNVSTSLERHKDLFVYSEVLPGLGQIKKGHHIHGALFLSLITGYAIYYYDIVKNRIIYQENHEELRNAYGFYYIGERVITEAEYYAEFDRRQEEFEDYERYSSKRSRAKALGVALYAANIIDMVFLMVWDAHKEKQLKNNKFSLKPVTGKSYTGFSLRFTF